MRHWSYCLRGTAWKKDPCSSGDGQSMEVFCRAGYTRTSVVYFVSCALKSQALLGPSLCWGNHDLDSEHNGSVSPLRLG